MPLLPRYNTPIFTDIFPDFASFKDVFDNEFDSYAKDCITASNLKTLYYLLYARYGANPFVNYTDDIIKAKVVGITFQKGPTWERKLAVQSSLRDLTESELLTGAKTIFNRALHPENEPGTDTSQELPYINAQEVSKQGRSKLDAYSYLQDVLKTDVTEEFIRSFASLFSKFVSLNVLTVYTEYEEEIEEEEQP